jgi:hypothetical protein
MAILRRLFGLIFEDPIDQYLIPLMYVGLTLK